MSPRSPVVPRPSSAVRARPIGLDGIKLTEGLWAERRRLNRTVTLAHGARQLEAAGNLENLRGAASGSGTYAGGSDDGGLTFPFLDSDVYKWLEAVGWELGEEANGSFAADADRIIGLVEDAQREDGYLNSYVQLVTPGREFSNMEWGHELYSLGHLVQAAIAWKRSAGDDRLLQVATRAVDRVRAELGPGRRDLIDGHPEIEMALVELFRLSGDERHLELAATLIDRRGRRLLRPDRFGPEYWQDAERVRAAREPMGHAVRQLYLDCGAVDLAVETDDAELLGAVVRRWEAMVASRTYLTGGLGARPRDEAFGAAYELPPDAAYAETCAAIASVMLAWRLLLASGDERYAELIERTSLNAVLAGIALDGRHFFYSNPLHVRRAGADSGGPTTTTRRPWFACACCPPNLMRFLATYPDLVATQDADSIAVHQFVSGTITADLPSGRVALRMATDYPWDGSIDIEVLETPEQPWTLTLRRPQWSRGASWQLDGSRSDIDQGSAAIVLERQWRPNAHLRVELPMPPRFTAPDPRIDAIRGTLAIERGPLVYAVEEGDLAGAASLDTIAVDPAVPPRVVHDDERLPGMTLLDVAAGVVAASAGGGWPYRDVAPDAGSGDADLVMVRAVPYFAWGNGVPGGMRVWLPHR